EMREKVRTFWTACDTCRVLHQFERKYLGHKLVCPGCDKSFKAVEAVQSDGSEEDDEEDKTLGDFMLKRKNIKKKKNGKMGCEKDEIFKGNDEVGDEKDEIFEGNDEVGHEK
ncbi:DnaJ heat shock N-terminal domain-containing family protein, partial [Trifolium medium]|nr:DnaJ heat shock N-terminal domain-containing family protein [Trifolium medium]